MLKYIDVSTYQGVIDWERVKPQIDGVIIRAGLGQSELDKYFVRNITECNRLDIPAGVYWFGYAYNPERAKNEARSCLAAIKPYRIELPVVWDFEYASLSSILKNNPNFQAVGDATLTAFCGTIEEAGYYAMLYSGKYIIPQYFPNAAKRFDKWIALYQNDPDFNDRPLGCGIWQWGGTPIDGISGNVDTNAVYNDYKAIIKRAGLNHLNDPPEPWYAPAMRWASEQGICDGTRPEEPATRAEVAQMIMNYHNKTK